MPLFPADTGHFHQDVPRQPRHLNGFPGWKTLSKIGGVNFVEFRKVTHVFQKAGGFQYVFQRHAACFYDSLEVFQNEFGLFFDGTRG